MIKTIFISSSTWHSRYLLPTDCCSRRAIKYYNTISIKSIPVYLHFTWIDIQARDFPEIGDRRMEMTDSGPEANLALETRRRCTLPMPYSWDMPYCRQSQCRVANILTAKIPARGNFRETRTRYAIYLLFLTP
jgi:hypothetical protein